MKLVSNFLFLSGAEVFSKIVTFAAIAYLARVLGPAGFGSVEFAGSVLLCAGLIVDQGFGPYGAREIAREPGRTGNLVGEIILTRFILAILAYASVIAFALWLNRGDAMTQLLAIYGLSLLPMPLLLQWVFQGHSQMQVVGILQLIRQTIFASVVFAFTRTPADMWIVGGAEIAGVVGAAAFGVWMYLRRFEISRVRFELTRRLFQEGVPIGLSQMFWMIRMFGATVIVGIIALPADVGFFGGAMRILIALHAFIWLYFFNLLPTLAQTWHNNDGSFAALIERSFTIVVWAGALGGIVWVLVAPLVMMTVYGEQFAPAGPMLQWLAVVAIVAALSGHYRFGLIAAGQQNWETLAAALGALVAIVLIPVGYALAGGTGAAMGLVAAEIVVWVSAWWWARARLQLNGHAALLIRPLIAVVIAWGLASLAPFTPSLQIALAVATIIVAALVLDVRARVRVRALFKKSLP